MRLPPNIPAPLFDLSAIIIGYILIDDLTPAEQNAVGSWLMLMGQLLCTNSAQQQVLNNRNNSSNSSNDHVINDTFGGDYNNPNYQVDMINKIISAMQEQINNLKSDI